MRRRFSAIGLLVLCGALTFGLEVIADDVVELTNGTKVQGKVTSQDGSVVVIDVMVNGKKYTRKYPKSNVKGVTLEGSSGSGTAPDSRTRQEVLDLIQSAGGTPPDWFESTTLDYPNTLDLSWPQPPPQPWNSSKNVGQFVWDRVNPNPGQWRNGVKLMHHIMTVNKDNKEVITRASRSLGAMYHNYFEDDARAAFWWQVGGVHTDKTCDPRNVAFLAGCYYRLGNKPMAMDLLKTYGRTTPPFIKLLGDMGETDSALKIAESGEKTNAATECFLYAGDVCRVANRLQDAERYYRKVIAAADQNQGRNQEHVNRDKKRAEASLAALQFYQLSPKQVADGTYTASSQGYEDQVHVEVVIAGGVIKDVKVTKHREKQFHTSLTDTPRSILDRQILTGIDTTSGATITSEAIINATAKALSQGKQ